MSFKNPDRLKKKKNISKKVSKKDPHPANKTRLEKDEKDKASEGDK